MKQEIKNERHTKEIRHQMQLIRRNMIQKKIESAHIYSRKQRTKRDENY